MEITISDSNYNKYCIVCKAYSNGKPQCKNCWNESQDFADELEDIPKYKKYWNTVNTLIRKTISAAHKEKDNSKVKTLCNKLIGIGFFADNNYIDGDEILDEIYEEINLIQKKQTNEIIYKNSPELESLDFRKQNPTDIHCLDGHYVRSKEERAIDDFLYQNRILHAYEPKFRLTPQEQNLCKKSGKEFEYFYPDFYIPAYNLYIEFFGKNDEQYNLKTELKIKIYSDRKDINFRYLTYKDSNLLLEKLEDIIDEFKNRYKK